jgi:hypothetical protein
MIDTVFSAADIIACPELLGVRLRPLSIWHVWALKAASSPFVDSGKYGIEDLCKAVMICSLTKADYEGLACIENGIDVLYGTIGGEYLALDADARQAVCTAFDQYLSACSEFPEFWNDGKPEDASKRLRCPYEWHLVATLLDMRICTSEAQAWDYPISRAQCWQTVKGERNGSRAYVDQRDRDDLSALEGAENGND